MTRLRSQRARPRPSSDADLRGLPAILAQYPERELWFYRGAGVVRRCYRDVHADVLATMDGLRGAGVAARTPVGLLGDNSYEWIVCDLALAGLDAVSVALPVEEFRPTSVEEIRDRYGLHLLLLSPAERDRRGARQPWIATVDDVGGARVEPPTAPAPPVPDDAFTVAFSSGTSGRPKPILMSGTGTADAMNEYARQLDLRLDDAIFIVLPLTAFPQRLMVYLAIWCGFHIRLADIPRMQRALREMAPTIVVGPPAFYETVEHRYHALDERARRRSDRLRAGLRRLPSEPLRNWARRRAFGRVQAAFGGRARLLLTGAAPARLTTLRLLGDLGLPLYEFYALTETSVISWNLRGRSRPGSVGRPLLAGTVRLADDGEVLVRFPVRRSLGYLGLSGPAQESVYRSDGWVATGDLGRFDEDGYLYITGRKKAVVITRAGYKVQPEPVEKALLGDGDVAHATVLGGDQAHVVTAVVSLRPSAAPAARTRLQSILDEVNETLPGPARVARLLCTAEAFTPDNGLLTRTMKPDRDAIARHFRAQLLAGAPDPAPASAP